jgi:hypothetical protein
VDAGASYCFLDHMRLANCASIRGEQDVKKQHDWIQQLYSLDDFADADLSDPDDYPDYVDIFRAFRNLHMIDWHHYECYENGRLMDFRLWPDNESGQFASYHPAISNGYFLERVVVDQDDDGIDDAWERMCFGSTELCDSGEDRL